jgi:AraC-like DNA-binding protein
MATTTATKDFPGTSLVVTGARLDEIRRTVFEKNPLEHEGSAGEQKVVIGTPVSPGDGEGFNPCGARHYLGRGEGTGYWDMMYITDGLLLSIADAQYRQPIQTQWPDDKVLKVRITLSGRMRDVSGHLICGPGDCTLSSYSGRVAVPYVLEATDEPYQSVCIHVSRPMLRSMHFDASTLGEPFRSLLERDELPDEHRPLGATHTLIGLARDMIQSRDMFSADTRRYYLGARAIEILVSAIEQLRPKTVPNTGANRVTQRDVSRINEARRILEASFAEPPGVQELARLVGINTTKLKLGFRELFGQTLQEFIVHQRMATGLTLIETTDLSISEIAYRVGYAYPASFTQAVRKHYGQTPQSLRAAGHFSAGKQ